MRLFFLIKNTCVKKREERGEKTEKLCLAVYKKDKSFFLLVLVLLFMMPIGFHFILIVYKIPGTPVFVYGHGISTHVQSTLPKCDYALPWKGTDDCTFWFDSRRDREKNALLWSSDEDVIHADIRAV